MLRLTYTTDRGQALSLAWISFKKQYPEQRQRNLECLEDAQSWEEIQAYYIEENQQLENDLDL